MSSLDEYLASRPYGDYEAPKLIQIIRELESKLQNAQEVIGIAYNDRNEWRTLARRLARENMRLRQGAKETPENGTEKT